MMKLSPSPHTQFDVCLTGSKENILQLVWFMKTGNGSSHRSIRATSMAMSKGAWGGAMWAVTLPGDRWECCLGASKNT